MKKRTVARRLVLVTGAVLAIAVCGVPMRAAAPKWFELRTANFLLQGDVGEADLRDVARRVEEFRDALSRLLPGARPGTAAPTVVLVFSNNKTYEPFKPTYEGKPMPVPGYFFSSRDINYITLVLAERASSYPIVFHEFTHQLVRATFGDTPPWFDEGIAEVYRSFRVSEDGSEAFLGAAPEQYVLMLREKFVPLADVLNADHDSPLYNDTKRRPMFYAESWALMHYALIGNRERMPQVFAFLKEVKAKVPVDQACQDAFGLTVAALEKEVQSYVGRVAFVGRRAPFSGSVAARVNSPARPLSPATVEARLGDLLMRMDRQPEGEAHLRTALELDPNDLQAQLSMGELCLRQRKTDLALGYLRSATATYDSSFEAYQALGVALVRRTGRPGAPQLAEARKALTRALQLHPEAPEAASGLAWVLMLSHERLDEAQRLAEQAVDLAPLEPDHALLLAQVLAQRNQFAAARERLAPLMTSDRADVREQARNVMALVANLERLANGRQGGTVRKQEGK